MPRRKGSTKAQREWFRAVREGRVIDSNDANTKRYNKMIENDERLIGQEAIAEYFGVSPETLRRWLRNWPAARVVIHQDPKSGIYLAAVGELMNLMPDVYEMRSIGQRQRWNFARTRLSVFN